VVVKNVVWAVTAAVNRSTATAVVSTIVIVPAAGNAVVIVVVPGIA